MMPRLSLPLPVLCGLAAALLTGCTGHFVPAAARPPVVGNGLAARLVGFDRHYHGALKARDARFDTRVHVAIDAAPGSAELRTVRLASTFDPPCSVGEAPTSLAIEGDETRPLSPGARLSFHFNVRFDVVAEGPTRIDIGYAVGGAPGCLPLEITSPKPEHAWKYDDVGVLTEGFGGAGYTHAVNGSTGSGQLSVTVGRWVGPFRLEAGSALALDVCTEALCPARQRPPASRLLALPILARADVFPVQLRHVAFGLGARYSFFATWKDPTDTARLTTYQALALAPILSFTAPNPFTHGVEGGVRVASLDFELPIGVATPLDDYRHPALSVGGMVGISLGF